MSVRMRGMHIDLLGCCLVALLLTATYSDQQCNGHWQSIDMSDCAQA